MIYASQQELDADVERLKPVLGLEGWTIVAKIKRAFDMPEGTMGYHETQSSKRFAYIRLLDPADYDPAILAAQCHRRTLIHEMLHAALVGMLAMKDREDRDLLEEQFVDAVAGGIAGLMEPKSVTL